MHDHAKLAIISARGCGVDVRNLDKRQQRQ